MLNTHHRNFQPHDQRCTSARRPKPSFGLRPFQTQKVFWIPTTQALEPYDRRRIVRHDALSETPWTQSEARRLKRYLFDAIRSATPQPTFWSYLCLLSGCWVVVSLCIDRERPPPNQPYLRQCEGEGERERESKSIIQPPISLFFSGWLGSGLCLCPSLSLSLR